MAAASVGSLVAAPGAEQGRPALYPLAIDTETLENYSRILELPGPDEALRAMARAVAASPALSATPGARLLVCRPSTRPLIAIVGSFDEGATASLRAQAQGLRFACRNLRWVGYPQVVDDCERLASRLTEQLGRAELERRHFTAVPRGGLVVLGLLASILGLDREQLSPSPPSSDLPLVVVDDCVLSGARCAGVLDECASPSIVFAHLYSHPQLRAAIEAGEPRVAACISAQDLEECGPLPPDWRRGWASRTTWKTYWTGCPEPLCLPWNEPDRSVWNPVTRRSEKAWNVVPPELCAKNRPAPGLESLPVQVQEEARGPLGPREEVLFGDLGDRTLVANLVSGEVIALEGVARRIWRSILRHGNLKAVLDDLARRHEAPVLTLRRDLAALVEELIARGFLRSTSS